MGNMLSSAEQSSQQTSPPAQTQPLAPLRVVIISDTHNDHRALEVPQGDILIHAGDFTCFGKLNHVKDFNEWLGTLPHPTKIVVNGNHESNAPWQSEIRSLLSNAIFLKDEEYRLPRTRLDGTACDEVLTIFGTNFYWPIKEGHDNPHYEAIPDCVDILVTHGPVEGYVDDGFGCPAMLTKCEALAFSGKLKLVVSGHIHGAYGMTNGKGACSAVSFINASSVGGKVGSRKIGNPAIVTHI